jgi:hypothetical protein
MECVSFKTIVPPENMGLQYTGIPKLMHFFKKKKYKNDNIFEMSTKYSLTGRKLQLYKCGRRMLLGDNTGSGQSCCGQ